MHRATIIGIGWGYADDSGTYRKYARGAHQTTRHLWELNAVVVKLVMRHWFWISQFVNHVAHSSKVSYGTSCSFGRGGFEEVKTECGSCRAFNFIVATHTYPWLDPKYSLVVDWSGDSTSRASHLVSASFVLRNFGSLAIEIKQSQKRASTAVLKRWASLKVLLICFWLFQSSSDPDNKTSVSMPPGILCVRVLISH